MRQFWPFGRQKWDQAVLAAHLDALGYPHVDNGDDGAVVVVPAGDIKPRHLNDILEGMPWAIVCLTSDERSQFEWRRIKRRDEERVRLWVSTPRPDRHEGLDARWFGEGYPDDTIPLLAPHDDDAKPVDVFFAGQNTHPRREECITAARSLPDPLVVEVHETPGFGQGLARPDYLARLASAKVALCPAGSDTPDSFRCFEALAAGAVPIVDGRTADPDYPERYWSFTFGSVPFPVIQDWSELEKYILAVLDDWEAIAAECRAWWLRRLRDERRAMAADVAAVS